MEIQQSRCVVKVEQLTMEERQFLNEELKSNLLENGQHNSSCHSTFQIKHELEMPSTSDLCCKFDRTEKLFKQNSAYKTVDDGQNGAVVKIEKLSEDENSLANVAQNISVKLAPPGVSNGQFTSGYSTLFPIMHLKETPSVSKQGYNYEGNEVLQYKGNIFSSKNCDKPVIDDRSKKIKSINQSVRKKPPRPRFVYSSDQLLRHFQNQLETHLEVKAEECKCFKCGKEFSRKSDLNRHLDIHFNHRYKCEICAKTFSGKGYVKRHIQRIHEGVRSFVCAECGKNFMYHCDLAKHMKVHTGEQPHKCQYC